MSPREVAELALLNLANGPLFIAGEQNKAMFDALLGMPRRDALREMADNIRAVLLPRGEKP